MTLEKKTSKILVGSFLVYAILVATHLGEFWPFSVYPMFSKAGRPWNRSLVRQINQSDLNPNTLWKVTDFDNLPGEQVVMNDLGISQNDIANMVSKTKVWDKDKVSNLRKLFGGHLEGQIFLIYKVRGEKVEDADRPIAIKFTPFTVLLSDTTWFNPNLQIPN